MDSAPRWLGYGLWLLALAGCASAPTEDDGESLRAVVVVGDFSEWTPAAAGTLFGTSLAVAIVARIDRVRGLASAASGAPDAPGVPVLRLDGTIVPQGGRLIIEVRVFQEESGALVWSRRYNRSRSRDPLELKDDLARSIVADLGDALRERRF